MDYSWIGLNCTKAFAKNKQTKEYHEKNSSYTVITYLHCLERQIIFTTSNILKATKIIID